MGIRLTVSAVGRMFGHRFPSAPGKCRCPFREHKRSDKTFRVFEVGGKELWKCWSCDAPGNVGDAVAMYAVLAGVTRRDAWIKLREDGYDVPGGDKPFAREGGRAKREPMALSKPLVGVRGNKPRSILPLDPARLAEWEALDDSSVRAFLRDRGFAPEFDFRSFGAIAMPSGSVGFIYRDPMSGKPCRVKVRVIGRKVFWNEPRPREDAPGAKALAPLFLADRLTIGDDDSVIIVEGELDALALASVGVENVVSLPDGAESAGNVSIEPLYGMFSRWYVATDSDEPGEKAWKMLRDRARAAGAEPVRVIWARMVDDELQQFKDANDALKAGFGKAEFAACLSIGQSKRVA